MVNMPVIYQEKCDGCGLCVSVCQCQALILVNNLVTIVETAECGYCTDCELVCLQGAILCPFEIVLEQD